MKLLRKLLKSIISFFKNSQWDNELIEIAKLLGRAAWERVEDDPDLSLTSDGKGALWLDFILPTLQDVIKTNPKYAKMKYVVDLAMFIYPLIVAEKKKEK